MITALASSPFSKLSVSSLRQDSNPRTQLSFTSMLVKRAACSALRLSSATMLVLERQFWLLFAKVCFRLPPPFWFEPDSLMNILHGSKSHEIDFYADMTGYSPSGKVSVYTDYSDSGLVTYVRKIVTQYTGITYTTDKCGYGCSDHASAYANGFRKLLIVHPCIC